MMKQMKPHLSTSSLTVEEELVNDGLQTATCFIKFYSQESHEPSFLYGLWVLLSYSSRVESCSTA